MNPSQNPSALRSKKEIMHTLLRLMQSQPYSDITVKQILLEAQVARKTFYRNYLSKDDVLDAYIDLLMQQYIHSLQKLPTGRLSDILDIILNFCIQNRDFFFLLKKNHLTYLFLQKWNSFIPMIHNQIVPPNHAIFQELTAEQIDYIIAFNVGAIWNVLMKWMDYDMKDSPDAIKATLLKYLENLSFFT